VAIDLLTVAAELGGLLAGHLQQLEGRLPPILKREWRLVAAQLPPNKGSSAG
jgi:hypothetical protein